MSWKQNIYQVLIPVPLRWSGETRVALLRKSWVVGTVKSATSESVWVIGPEILGNKLLHSGWPLAEDLFEQCWFEQDASLSDLSLLVHGTELAKSSKLLIEREFDDSCAPHELDTLCTPTVIGAAAAAGFGKPVAKPRPESSFCFLLHALAVQAGELWLLSIFLCGGILSESGAADELDSDRWAADRVSILAPLWNLTSGRWASKPLAPPSNPAIIWMALPAVSCARWEKTDALQARIQECKLSPDSFRDRTRNINSRRFDKEYSLPSYGTTSKGGKTSGSTCPFRICSIASSIKSPLRKWLDIALCVKYIAKGSTSAEAPKEWILVWVSRTRRNLVRCLLGLTHWHGFKHQERELYCDSQVGFAPTAVASKQAHNGLSQEWIIICRNTTCEWYDIASFSFHLAATSGDAMFTRGTASAASASARRFCRNLCHLSQQQSSWRR